MTTPRGGRKSRGGRDSATSLESGTLFEDVVLVVEGKKIYTTRSVLAYNSKVFNSLLAARTEQEDVFKDLLQPGSGADPRADREPVQIALPNQMYKDVKTMVSYLQRKNEQTESMSGEKALHMLPLTEQYKMSKLKKACGAAIFDTLMTLRQEHELGSIPTHTILKYLQGAENYSLEKVQKFCVNELAAKLDVTERQTIAHDKHISDKTKVSILNKMCDNMSSDYEKRLKEIRGEMNKRFRDIEKRREEFVAITESWKSSLRDEVDDVIERAEEAHSKLSKDLEQKKIIDNCDAAILQYTEELTTDIQQLKSQYDDFVESMESNLAIDGEQVTVLENFDTAANEKTQLKQLHQHIETSFDTSMNQIESICSSFSRKLTESLTKCNIWALKTGMDKKLDVFEQLDKTCAKIDIGMKALTGTNVLYEEERMEHEKTKASLRRLQKKAHGVNTWLRWGKPVDDDEKKCMCFRHAVHRQ